MNPFVADPHWGWWIVLYFFFGGIAAGAYFTATLIDLFGREDDHEVARVGYWVAFPLISLCGLFLTVDLERPERFWHMLFKSEKVREALAQGWPWTAGSWSWMAHAPLWKPCSPMSLGSWALTAFGVCSGLSFLGALWPNARGLRWLRHGVFARILQVVGSLVGFFIAAYTGTLLTATNQPVWSDTTWVAPLFLASGTSTGIAVLLLLTHYRTATPPESLVRLERADRLALGLELVILIIFLVSVGPFLPALVRVWPGQVLIVGTLILGLLVPLGLHLASRARFGGILAASVLVLVGGFLMRYALLMAPPELLSRGPAGLPEAGSGGGERTPLIHISPEDGRPRGGGRGADPGNDVPGFQPRSKVFGGDES